MTAMQITTCAPAESAMRASGASPPGSGARPDPEPPLRVRRGGATRVIDIHAHLAVPAAESVLRPHAAEAAPFAFSSPDWTR